MFLENIHIYGWISAHWDSNDLIPVVVVVLAPEVGKIVVVGIVEEFDITTERSTRNRKIRQLL